MKKQTKKKLEQELQAAIKNVLAKYDDQGIAKTKKVTRQAGKAIAKKFSKTIKKLSKKKGKKAESVNPLKKTQSQNLGVKTATAGFGKPKDNGVKTTTTPAASQPVMISGSRSTENQ